MTTPSLDYNEEFENQMLTDDEIEKVKAKAFINLLSDMYLKYETEIDEVYLTNKEELSHAQSNRLRTCEHGQTA